MTPCLQSSKLCLSSVVLGFYLSIQTQAYKNLQIRQNLIPQGLQQDCAKNCAAKHGYHLGQSGILFKDGTPCVWFVGNIEAISA